MPTAVLRSSVVWALLALTAPMVLALLLTGCAGQSTPAPAPVVVANVNSKMDIPGGLVQAIHLDMQEGQRIEGTVTVRAVSRADSGLLDVTFLAKDPSGQVTMNAGKVTGTESFAFVAAKTGRYDLVLDNSHSLLTPKAVNIVAQVWSK